ncbi:riboflavin biosynthesis protein RibF [uncultured Cardiobacterium sp.]|uniref:riboflavin biosynthesis protein RibF n=1 Tax=uncultured Cardiobacterium sp. TaxID=417619 RepID=UPI00261BCAA4|nr:riboflavin biosynthesis protein RibF [uncultured Cardiobacterium sp.]
MQIHRWQRQLALPQPVALTIGNFDGVHRGHQAILQTLLAQAARDNLAPVLLSFFPHPKALVAGEPPSLLTPLRDRAHWLAEAGLPHWLLLSFTHALMRKAPEDFVRDYLLPLRLRFLLVGDDFRFGYRGQGDFALLQRLADTYGFRVQALETVRANGGRISSSRIRAALAAHDLDTARELLGHNLTFTGKVRHGDGRGRVLQTPTANLHLPAAWCLPDGVYVVQVAVPQPGAWHWGVANVGTTPTFGGIRRKLEVHVFDQNAALYGQTLRVHIRHYLRDVRRFADAAALQAQIRDDIARAHAFINQETSHGRL